MTELFTTTIIILFFVLPLIWFLVKKALGCFLIMLVIGVVVVGIIFLLYLSGMTLMSS